MQEDAFTLVVYEMWVILGRFPSQFPALRQFYEAACKSLSPDQVKKLTQFVACQKSVQSSFPSQGSTLGLLSQRGSLPTPTPSPPPHEDQPSPALSSQPRQDPPARRIDVRLPPPRPGGKCDHISLRGADKRMRVNVNAVVETFGDSPDNTDTEPNTLTGRRPRKRKRTEGPEWSRVEYTVSLGNRPRDFILGLANFCRTLNIQQAIHNVISVRLPPTNTGTLVALTTEHTLHLHDGDMTKFWQMVIEVQIALRCESLGKSPRRIWDLKLSGSCGEVVGKGRFVRLHGEGKKLCRLVAGATLHIIPLIAFAGLKSKVWDLTIAEVSEVARLFRTPNLDPGLQAHIQSILDVILSLHSVINFNIHTQAGLFGHGELSIPQVVSSKDLMGSDAFFDSIQCRHIKLPGRSMDCWSQWAYLNPTVDCALGTLSPEPTDEDVDQSLLIPQLTEGDITSICCGLNPKVFQDVIPKDDRSGWTTTQRSKAKSCDVLDTVDQLSTWLDSIPSSGKPNNRVFRKIESTFNDGKSIHVTGVGGELIFLVIRSMPHEHRARICDVVKACYPNDFLPSDRGKVTPRTEHFCFWNQYAEFGTGAPEDIHPDDLIRSTQQESSVPKPKIPFLSSAITRDEGRIYLQLSSGLEDIFMWLSHQIERYLPSQFKFLSDIFEDLPLEPDFVAPYPFTKLVVNLGAQTQGHIDPKDNDLCVVVPFGEWEGGELCLYQPGVVLELEPGDVVVFPSNRIAHFNLEISGLRGSLVMATDVNLDAWKANRNHWKHAVH